MSKISTAAAMAYINVYKIKSKPTVVMNDENICRLVANAPTKLIISPKWDKESEEQVVTRKRFNVAKPDKIKLGNYLKEVFPEYAKSNSDEIILRVYKSLSGGSLFKAEDVLPEAEEEMTTTQAVLSKSDEASSKAPEVIEQSPVEIDKNKLEKEQKIMAQNMTKDDIMKDLDKQMGTEGNANIQDTKPATVDAYTQEAARSAVQKSREDRAAYSKRTKITGLVAARPSLKTRLNCKPEEAAGVIEAAAELMAKVSKKAGVAYSIEDGKIVLDLEGLGVKTGSNPTDIRVMMETLMAAKIDPNFKVAVNITDTLPAIKGYILNDGTSDEIVNQSEALDLLFDKSQGAIGAKNHDDVVLHIDAVKPRSNQDTQFSAAKAKKKKKNSAFEGLATLRMSNKKKAVTDGGLLTFVKNIDAAAKPEVISAKSGISIKVIRSKNGVDQEVKYRIPVQITVKGVVETSNKELAAKFKSEGLGNQDNTDLSPESMSKIFDQMTNLVAKASSQGAAKGGILADVAEAAASARAEAVSEDAAGAEAL